VEYFFVLHLFVTDFIPQAHQPERIMKRSLVDFFLFLCFSSLLLAQSPQKINIQGLADPHPIEWAVEVPWPYNPAKWTGLAAGDLLLQPSPALFQDRPGDPAAAVCVLVPPTVSNGTLKLSPVAPSAQFQFRQEGGRLYIDEAGHPALAFVYEPQLPEGVPENRRRAVYLHPLYDPLGQIITDDFPKDHYHHRGLSWMWPHVTVGNKEYNLWEMSGDIHQQFDKWLYQESGPVAAVLGMQNSWVADGRKVLEERVWLRVFRSSSLGRIIDLRLSFLPLEPISLLGADNKGYGGLSFRFAPRDCTVITSPAGLEQEDSNDQLFTWADLSARFRGADDFTGAAVLQHPRNPDAPAEWCIRHYGFLGVSWPGLHPVTLQPGQPVTFRFRIWLHRLCGADAFLPLLYDDFINPPKIRLIRN
jgi:hypothetical protein